MVLVIVAVADLRAQFTQPFKASDGFGYAKQQAQTQGLSNPTLSLIGSLGDTTVFGDQIPALFKSLLKFEFNTSTGTANFWGYRLFQKIGSSDSVINYAVVKTSLGFNKFSIPFPEIPGLPLLLDGALPESWMDSDVMATKVLANTAYKNYMASHPKATFQAMILGVSDGSLGFPGPLWAVYISDSKNGDALNCLVTATDNNGIAICEVLTGTEVKEVLTPANADVRLSVNSSGSSLLLRVRAEEYYPEIELRIFNALGNCVERLPLERIGSGVDIAIPIEHLASGTYFLGYRGGNIQRTIPFVIER
jgi:hypothetical protein